MLNTSTNYKKSDFFDTLSADFYAMEKTNITLLRFMKVMIIRPRFSAVFFFRCASFLNGKSKIKSALADIFWIINYYINGCEISKHAQIGDGLNLPHPRGIVIGTTVIGKNAAVFQHVTIGQLNALSLEERGLGYPEFGDNVIIFAGAVVVGGIKIGNNVKIGANAVVISDVPDNSLAVGVPAKVLSSKDESV